MHPDLYNSTRNDTWFRITYSNAAAPGLPPIIQADQLLKYCDDAGAWVVALWAPAGDRDDTTSACILRVPAQHVEAVTRHSDMAQAAAQPDSR